MARGKKPGSGRRKQRRKAPDHAPRTWGKPGTWAAAGAAIALALALVRFDPYLFTGGDNTHYYALARALATGRGYVDLITPGAPPHTHYPPGFPALLVPVYLLTGGNYLALKLVSFVAAAAALFALYRLASRDPAVPPWAAAAAVWLMGLYGVFQLYSQRVLSDMPYLALVLAALAVFQGIASDPSGARPDRRWLLACALALAAFYVRTAGVTLLAGVGAWTILGRRWKLAATTAAIFGTGAAPWFLWTRMAASGGGGGGGGGGGAGGNVALLAQRGTSALSGGEGPIVEFAQRLWSVFVEYGFYQFPQLFWPVDPPPVPVRVAALALGGALVVYGAWRAVRTRSVAPGDLYVAATLGILPFWPWLGDRYMLTIAPFLWLYLLVGIDSVARWKGRSPALAPLTAGALAVLLLVFGVAAAGRQWERTRAWLDGDEFGGYPPFWAEYFRAADWIGDNTGSDSVILARKPTLAWYWSERRSIPTLRGGNDERQWRAIERSGVTHILLEPYTERNLEDALRPRRELLRVLYQSPRRDVVVLGIEPGNVSEASPAPAEAE